MGRNLGPLNIKDTYEGLVQITSGSIITDGSGSDITYLNITASNADQAGTAGYASTAGFASQAGTSGFAVTASYAETASVLLGGISLQRVLDTGNTATEDINLQGVLSLGTGLVSTNINIQNRSTTNSILDDGGNTRSVVIGAGNTGAKQSIILGRGNIVGNGGDSSDNIAIGRNNTYSSDSFIKENVVLGALNNVSGAGTGRVVIGYNNDATAGSHGGVFAGTNNTVGHSRSVVIGGTGLSTTAEDQVVVPNLLATDITASNASFTSASIGYLQTITGSAKIIGDAFIILNNDTPTERYAGILVQDSGSSAATASFQFDGQTNDWFYTYSSSDDTDLAVAMFGPEYSTKGSPTYLTNNTIPKGDGGHHLNDSNISDDGTLVTINANVSASGYVSASAFIGDGSQLTGITLSPTLQDVTTNGNETTNDIIITGSIITGEGGTTDSSNNGVALAARSSDTIGSDYSAIIASAGNNNASGGGSIIAASEGASTIAAQSFTAAGYFVTNNSNNGAILAGQGHQNSGDRNVMIAGYDNYIQDSSEKVVINGHDNDIINGANSQGATIIGGQNNTSGTTAGYYGMTLASAHTNQDGVEGMSMLSSVSSSISSGQFGSMVGAKSSTISNTGENNSIFGGREASIAGTGNGNVLLGVEYGGVSGAGNNRIVIGGYGNTISGGGFDSVIGGESNTITTGGYNHIYGSVGSSNGSGNKNVILGGESNTISGGSRNVIIGGTGMTVSSGNDSVYVPNLVISGSITDIDGGQIATSSSLGTGTLVNNIGTPTPSEAINSVVYLTQAQYDALTPDDNTMYVISGSTDVVENLVVSGSMIGQVGVLTDAAGTTTLDCSTGNYFTLAMPAGGSTTLTPTNIQIGQTINIKITQNATASTLAYAASIDFPGGTAFTISTGAGEVDVLTLVSFDGTSLQATGLANFS